MTVAADDLQRLRADIQRLERGGAMTKDTRFPLAIGAAEIDAALPGGGLSRHGLHEVLGGSVTEAAAACGFAAGVLARATATTTGPVLWCSVHTGGDLYAPGLASYGIAPDRVLVVRPKDTEETFWAMEEGLRSGAVAAVLGHLGDGARPPSHTAFRRLQLAAERGGVPGVLLRTGDPARAAGPVATRWHVRAVPSVPMELDATWLGNPRFDVHLMRARAGAPGRWMVEWRYDNDGKAPGRFAVVAGLGDDGVVAQPKCPFEERHVA
jgi:protein ImuA